jgi:hypothetical protein
MLVTPKETSAEALHRVYREGLGRGDRCGWPSIDKLLSIAPGS